MQRWEYRVVSLRGRYTDALNEYGREGWELVNVVPKPRDESPPERGSSVPMPRAFGRLEDAAATLNKLGGDAPDTEAEASTTLLWVLRRPLDDDFEL
jgi:hypothetical protein